VVEIGDGAGGAEDGRVGQTIDFCRLSHQPALEGIDPPPVRGGVALDQTLTFSSIPHLCPIEMGAYLTGDWLFHKGR